MMPPSNTPPNGDFVRYIERLTTVKAAPDAKTGLPASGQAAPAGVSGPAAGGAETLNAPLEPLTQALFLRHVRWVFGLWLAVQILAWLVPGTGLVLLPLLVLYAAWAIFDHRQKALGAFLTVPVSPAGRTAEFIAKVLKSKANHHR